MIIKSRGAIICLLTIMLLTMTNLFSQPLIKELNQNWRFRQADKSQWYNAKVPGCVHTDLLDNSLIEDPFYRTNERDLQWIDKADWEYETVFTLDKAALEMENAELEFKGLDTYAGVFINGEKVLTADNMFREWIVDVKKFLKEGDNTLRIIFYSPINMDLPKLKQMGYQLPASNDQSENGGLGDKKVSIFARKAPYHYGWDWGPRFVTSGLWRPVYLRAWNTAKINNIRFIQNSLTSALAAMTAEVEVNSTVNANFTIAIKGGSGNEYAVKTVSIHKGLNNIALNFEIEKPRLWWPNGSGEQYLYLLEASVSNGNTLLDRLTGKTGLRTVEVVREEDRDGTGFYFKVNGRPMFMKGANYIPSDIFLNRVSPEDYEKLIRSASEANMNMLRVWGGGIYEDNLFYDLCDKYGILIWQDFMFACSMYPGDAHFLDNIRQEAIDNVKRLRNHPSIALWCGNNEIQDAWSYWGWKPQFSMSQQKEIYSAYKEIFLNILPTVCRQFDGSRFYWPSSPGSDYGRESKKGSGDMHYWGVWHAKEPFEKFQDNIGRFVSEYGFQSFPELKTVKSYTLPGDWDIESEVMASHQRSGIGNLRIRDYLKMYYKTPKDFESFLYAGQVLQAYGIKQAIETHRRNMPYCMGTLYWQLDDCWPVASWSGMDYYKRWKAQHYIAKKANEPVIISSIADNGSIRFYIVSDKFDDFSGDLEIKTMDFEGNELYAKTIPVTVKANSSHSYMTIKVSELLGKGSEKTSVVKASLKVRGESAADNLFYFRQPKDLALSKADIKLAVSKNSEGYALELTTSRFAKDVYLSLEEDEGFFTDNYFDLLPGSVKKLMLKTGKAIISPESKIKVISLIDSY